MAQQHPDLAHIPPPAVLVLIASTAASGDARRANMLVMQYRLQERPAALLFGMLRLANQLSLYYGGPLVASIDRTKDPRPLDERERVVMQVADAAWADGDETRAHELLAEAMKGHSPSWCQELMGQALAFAGEALMRSYTGDDLSAVRLDELTG